MYTVTLANVGSCMSQHLNTFHSVILCYKSSPNCYTAYVLRCLIFETHITTKFGNILLSSVMCHDDRYCVVSCTQNTQWTAGVWCDQMVRECCVAHCHLPWSGPRPLWTSTITTRCWSFGILHHLTVTCILKTKCHRMYVVQYFQLVCNKESQYGEIVHEFRFTL
jgi:hypothetical protein